MPRDYNLTCAGRGIRKGSKDTSSARNTPNYEQLHFEKRILCCMSSSISHYIPLGIRIPSKTPYFSIQLTRIHAMQ